MREPDEENKEGLGPAGRPTSGWVLDGTVRTADDAELIVGGAVARSGGRRRSHLGLTFFGAEVELGRQWNWRRKLRFAAPTSTFSSRPLRLHCRQRRHHGCERTNNMTRLVGPRCVKKGKTAAVMRRQSSGTMCVWKILRPVSPEETTFTTSGLSSGVGGCKQRRRRSPALSSISERRR
ncbi:bromodomain adjacent to zinc finger domain protein [Striga asiatica]|uniref:Bromodomain adjacent to zinc finger domain protein n=1 Tax=Striga asiatica TaxID=4170 RepID=A0A5A7PG61_STRAF|nr:bromodomain adjacent to zinc finger domain protein [Striga asiatica]